ncbi:MAG TPA: UDP-glucuronic acid decarboxylase family protein [Candidatus Udaeobacter sp.]|nr:UDP-glucuronic acid decarboxylase family protein [Candidatus Udaeobacter sp.]
MRILVTGGAGFIGSHLCERLLRDGSEVICLDNFFTGSKGNIRDLQNHPNFELIRHDVIKYIDIESDQIYNLACPASPVHYQHDAIRTIHANVLGVTNMLELARRTGARILQASTSEVYGDPEVHPQPETYWGNVNPIGVRSCYDEGKRVAETLMMDYHRKHAVDIRIARIFNTYGPRMAIEDGRVVSSFIVQALLGRPITVFGQGVQTRSFCYITDMIDGLIALMNHESVSGPVNLGNPEEFTIRELAETVIEMTGSMSVIEARPMPPDDPSQRQPDIALARRLFGWAPRISLREGLMPSIDYFESVLTSTRATGGRSAMRRRLRHQLPDLAAMEGDHGMRITARRRQNGGEA